MENYREDKGIVLTEDCLDRCFTCGKKFNAKGVYDIYCSPECEKKDQDRIDKMINEGKHPVEIMNEALKNISR